jgi:predicted AAA+ superfamily ATPase
MIKRVPSARLKACIQESKVVLVKGPRLTGKFSLVTDVLNELSVNWQHFDARKKSFLQQVTDVTIAQLTEVMGASPYTVIREAQYVRDLQGIIESVLEGSLNTTLILCCSFDPLMDPEFSEVLRMQGLEIHVYAPSFYEMAQHNTLPVEEKALETRLIYGTYPQVTEDQESAEERLKELVSEAVFTQLGVTDRINKGDKLTKMLQVVAFNIGEPVSYNEIAEKCGLDNETVERYVDLLEKAFILVRLPSFYNGHRYELKKTHVLYFLDNGIRNALINNFNPIDLRNDTEQLWRNWLIAERLKWNAMNGTFPDYFFWRTHTRQSMDFIESTSTKTSSYKISWEKKKKVKFPASFRSAYAEISTHVLNRSTYWGFLTKK